MDLAGNLIGSIGAIIIFIGIISFCCSSDTNSSTGPTQKNTKRTQIPTYYDDDSYCECPSCGAPYYDDYCEECGYPDINQGWIDENY